MALRAYRKEWILGFYFWSKKSTKLFVKPPNFGSKSCRCVTPPNRFRNGMDENLENVQIALVSAGTTTNERTTPDEHNFFSSLHNRPFGQLLISMILGEAQRQEWLYMSVKARSFPNTQSWVDFQRNFKLWLGQWSGFHVILTGLFYRVSAV